MDIIARTTAGDSSLRIRCNNREHFIATEHRIRAHNFVSSVRRSKGEELPTMLHVSFHRLGKTLALSDLHLNVLNGRFEEAQERRISDTLARELPDAVVLNGDTFDLFFGLRTDGKKPDMSTILRENDGIVRLLRKVPALYFLAGAHDQALRWDGPTRDIISSCFPNYRAADDAMLDEDARVVIVPGAQWYYDNVVFDGSRCLSLTGVLTKAFEDFLLSGGLDVKTLRDLYLKGKLGFWYKTGSHYHFLQAMAKAFECRIGIYFDRIAHICREASFGEWSKQQFYTEYRVGGFAAAMLAERGGPAMETLADLYWRMLGSVTKQRLYRYLDTGTLDYPPYEGIRFETAIVGHTHLVQTYKNERGRRMLFTGSTKPQTRADNLSCIVQHELGGGYVVIESSGIRLERFELEVRETDLQRLAASRQYLV